MEILMHHLHDYIWGTMMYLSIVVDPKKVCVLEAEVLGGHETDETERFIIRICTVLLILRNFLEIYQNNISTYLHYLLTKTPIRQKYESIQ